MTSRNNEESEQAVPFEPISPNQNYPSEPIKIAKNGDFPPSDKAEADTLQSKNRFLRKLAIVFYSPREHRLRSFWRLFIQYSCYLFLLLVFTLTAVLIPQRFFKLDILSAKFLELIAVTVSVFLARILLDRKTFVSLGLRTNLPAMGDLLLGFFIAGVMIAVIFALEWILGWLDFERFAWTSQNFSAVIAGTSSMFIIFVMVGWQEELLSRGYQLQNLEDGINLTWGVLLSSSFFALQHLGNPNISIMGIAGLIISGIFLAYAYLRTRQLWLPIGIHIGWNFFEGTVFGFKVSGINIYRIIEQKVHGPEIITGGAFGPEAGLILLSGLAVGFGLVYLITQSRTIQETSKL